MPFTGRIPGPGPWRVRRRTSVLAAFPVLVSLPFVQTFPSNVPNTSASQVFSPPLAQRNQAIRTILTAPQPTAAGQGSQVFAPAIAQRTQSIAKIATAPQVAGNVSSQVYTIPAATILQPLRVAFITTAPQAAPGIVQGYVFVPPTQPSVTPPTTVGIGLYQRMPRLEYFFDFGDKRGEANWVAFHHARHRTYDLIASQRGVSLPAQDFTGPIDDDWFYRHATRHTTHRRLLGTIKGFNTYGLPRVRWDDPTQMHDWLYFHALEHADLDEFYGIT